MNKTQLFAKSEKELCPYLPAYKAILSATAWVNPKTGEAKRFSAEQKLVWHYVLDRYKFFKDSNKDYFDNQADIAIACDVSERTVIRLFKELSIAGYLEIHQIRVGGHKSNSYKIIKDLILVQRENIAQKAPASPVVQRSEESNINTQPDVFVESEAAGKDWVNESIPCEDYEGIQFSIEAESSSYEDWESTEVETAAAPAKVEVSDIKIDLSSMPLSRWNRNGREISDQLFDWFEDNGFYIEDCRTGQVLHNSSKQRYVMSGKDLIPLPDNAATLEQQEESFLPF
ncbi:hypothetical protein [Pseudomonas sp. MS15a(2019)]|uniref:DUF6945 domain-containing protein n=1 Tax=Pseudomonas sp. MS15a(2019) TaxID=2579938 RepID=UPI001567A6B3|nr:hypothetical protein [Pseudomonas sp. MS15a(2019)]NRH40668.1 hypothetical protein [Pseudomonas sp. MS15a(2019)]